MTTDSEWHVALPGGGSVNKEPNQYATTWGELWQHIKDDRKKQIRSLVLLLFIFVGVPLEVWGFLLLPLVGQIVAVLVAMPVAIWAWRGL